MAKKKKNLTYIKLFRNSLTYPIASQWSPPSQTWFICLARYWFPSSLNQHLSDMLLFWPSCHHSFTSFPTFEPVVVIWLLLPFLRFLSCRCFCFVILNFHCLVTILIISVGMFPLSAYMVGSHHSPLAVARCSTHSLSSNKVPLLRDGAFYTCSGISQLLCFFFALMEKKRRTVIKRNHI